MKPARAIVAEAVGRTLQTSARTPEVRRALVGKRPPGIVAAWRSMTRSGGWWLCPNDPPCPHGAILHDVEDYEDDTPRCCADGCECGKKA